MCVCVSKRTVACRMEDRRLENDERRSDRLLNLHFDRIRLVLRHRGHHEEVRRAHEEVSVGR